jgi:hypothetical protein
MENIEIKREIENGMRICTANSMLLDLMQQTSTYMLLWRGC